MTTLRCSNSLIAARGLMQQVNLHKLVFPLSVVFVNLANFGVTLLLLLGVRDEGRAQIERVKLIESVVGHVRRHSARPA